MTTITLTPEEIAEADRVAHARQSENLALNRPDAYGAAKKGGLALHISGARGEKAVAKLLGRPWNGNLGNLKAADVGDVQVRATKHAHGKLILHPKDGDDDWFYLVIDRSPEFDVRGPIQGRDGKQQRYWRDPTRKNRYAFFVPQSAIDAGT